MMALTIPRIHKKPTHESAARLTASTVNVYHASMLMDFVAVLCLSAFLKRHHTPPSCAHVWPHGRRHSCDTRAKIDLYLTYLDHRR